MKPLAKGNDLEILRIAHIVHPWAYPRFLELSLKPESRFPLKILPRMSRLCVLGNTHVSQALVRLGGNFSTPVTRSDGGAYVIKANLPVESVAIHHGVPGL